MRHFITILGLFVLTNIFGQDFKKFDYQLDMGTTLTIPYKRTIEVMTEIEGHPVKKYGSNFGCFFEFLISYNINEKYGIESGLNYYFSKLKINDKIGIIENKGELTNCYLNLPIFIKYRVVNNLSISCGPYIGLILGANENGTSYIDTSGIIYPDDTDPVFLTNPVQEYNKDLKNRYKDIDLGLSGQLAYDIKLNNKLTGLIFSRFNYGLINILNENINHKWKNYNLIIGLGIKI